MLHHQFIPNKDLFDNYAEAVLIASADNVPLYINPAFTALTGFDDAEAIGIAQLQLGTGSVIETTFTKSDGSLLQARVSASKITLTDNSVGTLYTLVFIRSQEQLQCLLTESEQRFNALADASPALIWISDTTNQCTYLNKSWVEFTGRSLEEQLGSGWLGNIHPDDLPLMQTAVPQMALQQPFAYELRLKRYDGEYRNIYIIGTPRLLPQGTFIGYMGSCLDITEMIQAQNELTRQAKELKRSNEELEQFAYVASHDLQEPLRMIGSYIQLIQKAMDKEGTPGHVNEFMNFVLDGVSRMQALISDLLQLSRVIKKGNPFILLDMNEVVKTALSHLEIKIKENGATVKVDKLPSLKGDGVQLIRLMQNLVENALKFKSADRQPYIEICVEDNTDLFKFSIKDNGIGIDNKFYNRIFVIFQRLHNRSEYEGTGIGLAVCKKIVERHGGEIWVTSEVGKGSTFYFTLKK